MRWRLIRKFPKAFIVFGVIAVSTVLFAFWWTNHKAKLAQPAQTAQVKEEIRPKLALLESAPKNLLLVDNDLYDLNSGALVFKDWLKGGTPLALFYDSKAKTIVARYERGFVRYSLDGKEEASLVQKSPPAFSEDLKWVIYAKAKDLWRADVDWNEWKFINDRRLTTIEQFNEQYFAANILLGTEKVAIIRNNNQLLRLNLDNGEVKPVRIPLGEIGKRRSPSGRYLVGVERGEFYCYDLEEDDSKSFTAAKITMNDCQWLGNDRCVMIAAGKVVILYDRVAQTLTEVTTLPSTCQKIGEPSPDGLYVFCVGARIGYLVDLQKNSSTSVTAGAGISWINADTFAFSREVQDSELRGTWLQTAGEGERRLSFEPYLVARAGPMLLALNSGTVVFATKHGLSKMKADGTGVAEFLVLQHPPVRAIGLQEWKQ